MLTEVESMITEVESMTTEVESMTTVVGSVGGVMVEKGFCVDVDGMYEVSGGSVVVMSIICAATMDTKV